MRGSVWVRGAVKQGKPLSIACLAINCKMAAKVEERILYDLLVPLEWPTEREDLVSSSTTLST